MSEEPKEHPDARDREAAVILAAVDTSPGGNRVVETAARLARRNYETAVLHIVHVFKSSWLGQNTVAGLHIDELMEEGRRYLDHYVRMARRQCPAEVIPHFAIGEPSDEIVRIADSSSADLLVIGAQDEVGTIERLLLGTVTGNVMQRARCSVLVVRPRERPPRRT